MGDELATVLLPLGGSFVASDRLDDLLGLSRRELQPLPDLLAFAPLDLVGVLAPEAFEVFPVGGGIDAWRSHGVGLAEEPLPMGHLGLIGARITIVSVLV